MPSRQPDHVTARQAAIVPELLGLVIEAVNAGRPADATLAGYFRAHRKFGSRDRRLFSQLVFSYFRWLGWLRNLPPPEAAALAWLHDTPETQEIHPVIEKILQSNDNVPTDGRTSVRYQTIFGQSVELLVPEWLRDELYVPPGDEAQAHFERFVRAMQVRPPTWVRIRAEDRAETMEPADFNALRKKMGPVFEVQDLASQRVGRICVPAAGERWWDVCAGAGGKSLHLADLKARVVATDIRESALKELQRRAREAGVTTISTSIQVPASSSDFDGVLIDAPCSGIGTWSRNPDMRWRTPREMISQKAAIQRDLMARCADAVKRGGKLVYAVCTVTRAETVEVVDEFLRARKDFALDEVACVWPWEGPCDGMFIARFRRAS